MPTCTLTSKGQITIPKEVRERLRLKAGDRLDFQIDEDGSVRVLPVVKRVTEVFGLLAEKASRRYTPAESRQKLKDAFRKGKL